MAEPTSSIKRAAKQFKSVVLNCRNCNVEVFRRSSNQRFCCVCAEAVNKIKNRENEERKRRDAGVIGIGSVLDCPSCGRKYEKTNSAQKDCPACANARRIVYERLSKQKAAASAPPRKRNSEKDRLRLKRWEENNPGKRRRSVVEYNVRNREAINAKALLRSRTDGRRAWRLNYERQRRSSDPKYRLNCRMKANIKRCLREGKSGRSWALLAGYSVADLYRHLERQFLPGMSWANMGEWHIDHRLPLSSFKFETFDDPEFKAAWSLTNLQPLWSAENFSKGRKRLLLL